MNDLETVRDNIHSIGWLTEYVHGNRKRCPGRHIGLEKWVLPLSTIHHRIKSHWEEKTSQ